MTLEELYSEIPIPVYDWEKMPAVSAIVRSGASWGIFLKRSSISSSAEEKYCLAHEYGHYSTGATHSLSSKLDIIEQHELMADKFAFRKLCPVSELMSCAEKRMRPFEIAEYLGVPESLIHKAHEYYYANVDDYRDFIDGTKIDIAI